MCRAAARSASATQVGVDARHGQAAMAHATADGACLGHRAELGRHEVQPIQGRANAQPGGQLPVASAHRIPPDCTCSSNAWTGSEPAGRRHAASSGGSWSLHSRRAARRMQLTFGFAAHSEGFEPPTARSVAWCSASIWSAPDGSGLLRLDASSVQTDPVGSRRIAWMIKRMIKQAR